MDNRYNLYNFEASFKEYLLAGNKTAISVKNYLSDFRHFIGWLTFYIQNESIVVDKNFDITKPETIQFYLTGAAIDHYKAYLIENSIPLRTINRRLSTVRKFCSFCISQGWMKNNPGKQIANIQSESLHLDVESKTMLDKYRTTLQQKQNNQHSIANSLNDIEEFLHIISS